MGPGSAAHRCTPRCARGTDSAMLNFLARRVVQLIPTLFFVSVLIFSLQQLLPGDPALVMAGAERDPERIAQIPPPNPPCHPGSMPNRLLGQGPGSRVFCGVLSHKATGQEV